MALQPFTKPVKMPKDKHETIYTLAEIPALLLLDLNNIKLDIKINESKVISFSYQLSTLHLRQWLNEQSFSDKFYYQHRHKNHHIAATVVSKRYDHIQQFEKHYNHLQHLYVFYRSSFPNHNQQRVWEAIAPLFVIEQQKDRLRFICQFIYDQQKDPQKQRQWIQEQIKQLQISKISKSSSKLEKSSTLTHTPPKQEWISHVNDIKTMCENQQLEKVVLARKTRLNFSKTLDVYEIADLLISRLKESFVFIWQNATHASICVSPELLAEIENNKILCDVMAGTRVRGRSFDQDHDLEIELFNSKKDRHEHGIVKNEIVAHLQPYTTNIKSTELEIKKLARVQHLYQQLSANLNTQAYLKILEALSPSAAVCGHPRNKALHQITNRENYTRSWYTGYCGVHIKQNNCAIVSIRYAELYKKHIDIYAGAGLVKDSVAENEWQEINDKMSIFLDLLH